ncbi:SAM dependent methyltransferase [Ampelomyces quisqualis]|uniref:SAM dependent methyltransferase n=1 Tax=Ampelomyces quisqualis TaxID=50730 RepID=A0A6A5QY14_AMPQU|nr:SAM dependent methyltransferase [Ampelomyces quisqualis]
MADIEAQIAIDSDETDSAFGDTASDTTSLKSAILNYKYRNGRRYHAYKEGSYWGPNDEMQADQLDITHHIFLLLLDGELYLAPITENPLHVLDLGAGTGIWAIDFADRFPSAEVLGTDLSPTQPSLVPPNLCFEVDDFTEPWLFRKESFDFIHARTLYGCVADWSVFYKEALDHLQPGGYFEQLEISVVPKSDDGTVLPGSIMEQWGKISLELGELFGKSLNTVDESKAGLEAAGFINIVEHRWKLPVGGWPVDKRFKEIGQYNRINWEQGIEGWCMYLLTTLKKWSVEEVQVYLAKVRQALRDRRIHAYQEVSLVYGQKPPRPKSDHVG